MLQSFDERKLGMKKALTVLAVMMIALVAAVAARELLATVGINW